jgi:hypothetical protein
VPQAEWTTGYRTVVSALPRVRAADGDFGPAAEVVLDRRRLREVSTHPRDEFVVFTGTGTLIERPLNIPNG